MIHFANASCFKSLWISHHISVFTLTPISLLKRKDRKSSFVPASKSSLLKELFSFLYWLLVETLSTAGLRVPALLFDQNQSSLRAPSFRGPLAAFRSARLASSSFLLSSRFFFDSSTLLRSGRRKADVYTNASSSVHLIWSQSGELWLGSIRHLICVFNYNRLQMYKKQNKMMTSLAITLMFI